MEIGITNLENYIKKRIKEEKRFSDQEVLDFFS